MPTPTPTPTTTPEILRGVVRIYLARQTRRDHPDGSFDRAGRWYPSDAEWRDCCGSIREPSRAWPHSLNKHCRSIEHVAALCSVEARELRRAARRLSAEIQSASSREVAVEAVEAVIAEVGAERWSDYNRKFNDLLMRGAASAS